MGTYATTTTLDTRMLGITFDTATTNIASEAISDAENEIDKYLSKRYDLSASPFNTTTTIPPMVTTMCLWLAQGYMYLDMSRGGKESMDRGQMYINRAIKNLELIRDFKVDLVDSNKSAIADVSTGAMRVLSNTKDYTPTFGEDDPLNWKVDTDKLSDISDSRD